jgi:hypothetical protein
LPPVLLKWWTWKRTRRSTVLKCICHMWRRCLRSRNTLILTISMKQFQTSTRLIHRHSHTCGLIVSLQACVVWQTARALSTSIKFTFHSVVGLLSLGYVHEIVFNLHNYYYLKVIAFTTHHTIATVDRMYTSKLKVWIKM